jgi:hypothetical protein
MRLISPFMLLSLLSLPFSAQAGQENAASCRPTDSVVQLPGLAEASGLALSRRTPGRLWSHNDSGEPVLFALDSRGTITDRVRISGATVEDWEAIAVGPCGTESCIYIADIGDNEAGRERITVYRLPEPASGAASAAVAETYHATYPDGAHDAESLFITPEGRLHIVTKGETGPVGVYRFPAQLPTGQDMKLERVGAPVASPVDAQSRITDGSISPDGQWIVLRTRSSLSFYRASELLAGQPRVASRVDLRSLKEPQGEGVALGPGDAVFLASEGGGKGRPGTFARFTCAIGR